MAQQAHRPSRTVPRSARTAGTLRTTLAIGASTGAIALLGALPAAPANATPAASGATTLTPASLTLPSGDLESTLSRLPAGQLGLGEAELKNLLSGLSAKLNPLLAALPAEVDALLEAMLQREPKASLSEVLSSVNGLIASLTGNQLTLKQLLEALNPEQLSTVLSALLNAEGLHSVLDQLAGRLGPLGSEGQQTLRSILTALLGSLPEGPRSVATQIEQALEGAGHGALQAILEGLKEPGALSAAATERVQSLLSELSTISPAQLQQQLGALLERLSPEEGSALLLRMLGTLSPTQLASTVQGLLGGLGSLSSTSTPEELVNATGGTLPGVADELSTSVNGLPSSLPALTASLGSKGPALSAVDGLGHLVLSLTPSATEGASSGAGGAAGSGGAGAGGVGGAGGSGGAGTTHSGGPAPALTVLVNVPRAARQPHRSRIRHRRPGHVRILNHWVRGGMATVALHVPAAGHLVLKGRGLHRQRRRIGHAGRVVLRLRVTRAGTASLRRRRRLRVRVTVLFTPRRGARSRASALLTFHHHRQHRR